MIHFLRQNGNTIVDIEVTEKNIYVFIDIQYYSIFLLNNHFEKQVEIIADFSNLQELRGIYFESIQPKISMDNFVRECLKPLAQKYNLQYVTD